MLKFEQGDILQVEKISEPVLVVSKNYFNKTEQAIVCPICKEAPRTFPLACEPELECLDAGI